MRVNKFILFLYTIVFLSIPFAFSNQTKQGKNHCNYKKAVVFYFDYYGCHLCNDKKVRIIKKLQKEKPQLHIVVYLLENRDRRRLIRWFKNFDTGITPDFTDKFLHKVILKTKNGKQIELDDSLTEKELLGRILKWAER